MINKKKVLDMTKGDPLHVITAFALPMIISNLFQQMYNVVDSMIVGNYLGMQPFAAIGSTGMITAVLVQLSTGLSLGGSIVAAQFYGSGRRARIRLCATTLSIFMVITAAILTAIVLLFCNPLLKLIATPESILPYAETYLKIYALGNIPIFLYNALGGIYSALGNSKTPLRFLIISSVLNIMLDLLFIVVFGMGVGGAAAATVISQFAAMALAVNDIPVLLRSLEDTDTEPLNERKLFDKDLLTLMLRFAIPAALQQSIVSIGSVIVQATINSFGTEVIAACAGASKIINLVSAVPANFSNAYGNYVGQNVGAKKIDRVYTGLRASIICCGGISLVLTAIMELFPERLMQLFMSDAGSAYAITVGAEYIRVTGGFLLLFTCYMLTKAVFKGSGDMSWFLFVTLLSFVIRLILTVGLSHTVGVWMIWWSIGIGWIIAFAVSLGRLLEGGWKKKGIT